MIRTLFVAMFLAIASVVSTSHAVPIIIEPDDYAEGTVVNDVHPLVQLRIFNGAGLDNFPVDFGISPDPTIIPVTANENADVFGGHFTSTGIKSFGHANIDFIPESRQLAMRFLVPARSVSIDFIGTSTRISQVGVLEVFNGAGTLLDTHTSTELLSHQIATLSLTRAQGDIVYARAFSHPDFSPFGTLDHLRGDMVPEPTSAALLVLCIGTGFLCRRGQHRNGGSRHAAISRGSDSRFCWGPKNS